MADDNIFGNFTAEELAKIMATTLGKARIIEMYRENPVLMQALVGSNKSTIDLPEGGISALLEDTHHAPTILQNGSKQYPEYVDYYRIIDVLGEGGMGAVYKVMLDEEKARKLGKSDIEIKIIKANLGYKPDDKEVVAAMKVIKPEAVDQIGGRARFKRELDVYKDLSDIAADTREGKGGVLPILEDGTDYFIMPILVPIKKEKLDEEKARVLGFNASRIIAEVHKRGKIHRDIKPDNFLLVDGEDYSSVVASDFGLVKNIGEEATMQTMSRAIMGTPDYMSPEQANAQLISHLHEIDGFYDEQVRLLEKANPALKKQLKSLEEMIESEKNSAERQKLRTKRTKLIEQAKETVTRDKTKRRLTKAITKINKDIMDRYNLAFKSDQYALAATVYTWATGEKPRYKQSGKELSPKLKEMPVMALLNNITDPNTELEVLPQELGVSDALSAVILKGMEKDPNERYESTDAFVADLEKVMNGEMPLVLVEDSGYLERRMLKKAGAEYFLNEKQYRLGRERLEELVADVVKKSKAKPDNIDLQRQKKKWKEAFADYTERMRARLSEMKDFMGKCSDEDFTANVPEFLELIYEVKIVPVEKRIGDSFPSSTDEHGKWKINDGIVSTNGYWNDILNIGNLVKEFDDRVKYLKGKEDVRMMIEDFLKAYQTFGKNYDKTNDKESQKIFLEKASELESQFNDQCGFIPNWDKEELDSQGLKLGGYALAIESLMIIPALFNANRHTPDNRFAKIAVKHIDKINENLARENGSVYRYGIFDEEGNLLRTAVDGLAHHIEGKDHNQGYDKFENEVNTSNYTWAYGQTYFINGNLDAFMYTGDKKYLDYATKAINFAINQIKKNPNLISNYAYNDPNQNPVQNSAPNAMLALALEKYFKLTGKESARKSAIALSKAIIKGKLDVSQDYEGLVRGYRDNAKSDENSAVEVDGAFLTTLSELEKSTLYESRTFVSTIRVDKLGWNKANYQAGFTGLDNAVADEQTELRIMHDDENLYLRIRALGDDIENDFYDVLIGDKRFKLELDGNIKTAKIPYSKLGLDKKPDILRFNLMRNRINEKGKRTTINSWSPNQSDLYIEEKKMYSDAKDELKPEYGTLILK